MKESITNTLKNGGAKIQIELNDGSILIESADYPKGDPENPVSKESLVQKFKVLASELSHEQQVMLIHEIDHLEKVTDLQQLMALVAR